MKKLIIITIIVFLIAAFTLFTALNLPARTDVMAEPEETPQTTEIISTPEPSATPDIAKSDASICYSYLSDDMFEPNAEAGTVELVTYTTQSHEKKMQVYLPYGYSDEKQYNVLILMHGSDGNEGYWFGQYQFYGGKPVELQNLIDNMIYFGYCEPLIIVSPTFYLNDDERDEGTNPQRDFSRMAAEIRTDIIPYIKEHYSTYDSRNHFGFIGASYGSIILYNSVLPQDLGYISWWGAISGYQADIYTINSILATYGDDIGIDYFYTSAGSKDSMKPETVLGYNNMLYLCPKIDGSNICYTEILDAEHEGRVWVNGIYNCLLIFFK